jgi:hypothetical protein
MPSKSKTARIADLTPDQREKRRAKEKARNKRKPKRVLTPEQKAKRDQQNRESYHRRKNGDKYRNMKAAYVERVWGKPDPKGVTPRQKVARAWRAAKRLACPVIQPAGSVAAASVASSSRDMLLSLMRAVPFCDDREDIISEAAVLMLEGLDQGEAIAIARKRLRKNNWHIRNSVWIEDCKWL